MTDSSSADVWKELAAASVKIREEAARLHPAAEQVRVVIGPVKGRMALAWVDIAGEERHDKELHEYVAQLPKIDHVRDITVGEWRDGMRLTVVADHRNGRTGENAFVMLDIDVRDLQAL